MEGPEGRAGAFDGGAELRVAEVVEANILEEGAVPVAIIGDWLIGGGQGYRRVKPRLARIPPFLGDSPPPGLRVVHPLGAHAAQRPDLILPLPLPAHGARQAEGKVVGQVEVAGGRVVIEVGEVVLDP